MICYFLWCTIKVYKMCNSIGTFQQLIPQTTKPILSVTGAPLPLSLSLSLTLPMFLRSRTLVQMRSRKSWRFLHMKTCLTLFSFLRIGWNYLRVVKVVGILFENNILGTFENIWRTSVRVLTVREKIELGVGT